ncbi:hypothetical protein ACQBAT_01060 [Ornithinimicrobium sp. Y1847]|uniref:hypothetical protein n=1 Tax=unclassified Ornithinimicrobium TaxID=2615080 RepID=UPI003B686061
MEEGAERSVPGRLLERVRAWVTASPRNAGYAVALLALILTIPFGGLAAAPQEEQPVAEPGTEVAVAP